MNELNEDGTFANDVFDDDKVLIPRVILLKSADRNFVNVITFYCCAHVWG